MVLTVLEAAGMSSKHIDTTADLVRYGCRLKVECTGCGAVIDNERRGCVEAVRTWRSPRYPRPIQVRALRNEGCGVDYPTADLTAGTTKRLICWVNMRRHNSKERWLKDREQLLKALRGHGAGRTSHLSLREQDHFVESVKRRIADLNEKIARADGAEGS